MMTRPITTTLAALTLVGLLGACSSGGGGSEDDVASVTDDDNSSEQAQGDESGQALVDWVECMRGEGWDDLPDPSRDADGNLVINGNGITIGVGLETNFGAFSEDERKAAEEVCGIPPLFESGVISDESRQAEQAQLLEFAKCMREQGLEDFPDPDFTEIDATEDLNGDGVIGPFPPLSESGAEAQAAAEACRDLMPVPGGAAEQDGGSDG